MKTEDIIINELMKVDKIAMKALAQRIDRKIDTTSHQVKKLVKEGLVRSERVRLGRSYNTFVWLADRSNIQLEKDKIQLESLKSTAPRSDQEKTLATNNLLDPQQKLIQVEKPKTDRILQNPNIQLELTTDMLRSYYRTLTLEYDQEFNTFRGKSHRGNRNDLIDKIHQELDKQRGD